MINIIVEGNGRLRVGIGAIEQIRVKSLILRRYVLNFVVEL